MTKQQYIEYLAATPNNYTCTHLADHLEGEAASSHDAISDYLRRAKPDVLQLGECETPDLALKPFGLDYGWKLFGALKDAANGGDASGVEAAWREQNEDFPVGMKHLSLQDAWDATRDVSAFGGAAGARAAAVFNFTSTGVPLLYNGMEVGNAGGGVNPHTRINWSGGDPRFPRFYHQLLSLRRDNPALRQGAMTWLPNSASSQLLTYTRIGGGTEFLVEINLSLDPVRSTLQARSARAGRKCRFPVSRARPTRHSPKCSCPHRTSRSSAAR